jgi:hypothetical protein
MLYIMTSFFLINVIEIQEITEWLIPYRNVGVQKFRNVSSHMQYALDEKLWVNDDVAVLIAMLPSQPI